MRILLGVHFRRPNNRAISTWALSQVTALRDAGHEVRLVSPLAAIPVFATKLLRRGTSATCPPHHVWDGIETDYVRWPIYPVANFWILNHARPIVTESTLLGHYRRHQYLDCCFRSYERHDECRLPEYTHGDRSQRRGCHPARTENPSAAADARREFDRAMRRFFYKRKNVPLMVASFDQIAGRYPEALLVIIGNGGDRSAVASSIEAATHRSHVRLLGALEHRNVLQHMIWCDVFASIADNEPFGIVFAEAMMAGKPIIYATDCGINDVVTDGVPTDALKPRI